MNKTKTLLLHTCCAPCSSAVLERLYLDYDFETSLYFYNPNIMPAAEYEKRLAEQQKLLALLKFPNELICGEYDESHKEFLEIIKGSENEPEGGERCEKCIKMRLCKTAQVAKERGYEFFTTTLSVSPHKNAKMINKILEEVGSMYGAEPLFADFKKKDGYKRSIELSKEYNLYRQNYCGCKFSEL